MDPVDGFGGPPVARVALRALSPPRVAARLTRRLPRRFLPLQIYLGSFARAAYAYGLYLAAWQARRLGFDRISALEFGVAGGCGLLALESYADRIGAYFDLAIEVHGFDAGTGLPAPRDYRDHPFLWQRGDYRLDEAALRARLRDASLWLGPVADTLGEFDRASPAPLGFVSFDLDYYSSTRDALGVFDRPSETRLPRVACYFDDTLVPDYAFFNEASGELLAIDEFNGSHEQLLLARLRALPYTKPVRAPWQEQTYVLHDFAHPRYADPIRPAGTASATDLPR